MEYSTSSTLTSVPACLQRRPLSPGFTTILTSFPSTTPPGADCHDFGNNGLFLRSGGEDNAGSGWFLHGFHRLEQNTICKGYQFHDANLQYDV